MRRLVNGLTERFGKGLRVRQGPWLTIIVPQHFSDETCQAVLAHVQRRIDASYLAVEREPARVRVRAHLDAFEDKLLEKTIALTLIAAEIDAPLQEPLLDLDRGELHLRLRGTAEDARALADWARLAFTEPDPSPAAPRCALTILVRTEEEPVCQSQDLPAGQLHPLDEQALIRELGPRFIETVYDREPTAKRPEASPARRKRNRAFGPLRSLRKLEH